MNKIITKYSGISAIERDAQGPLIVLLHGIQGSKELFLKLINESTIKSYPHLAIDFPGFGDSPAIQEFNYTVPALAELVQELIEIKNPKDVILIGHSLGAMVCIQLLKSTKLHITGLISLEGNLVLEDCSATKDIYVINELTFINDYLPNLLQKLLESNEPSAPFRLSALRKANPKVLYKIACEIVKTSESGILKKILSEAVCPTLKLVGAKSTFYSRQLPGNTEIKTIPDASHFLIHDNFNMVVSAVNELIAANAR